MFEITIKGETLPEVAEGLRAALNQFADAPEKPAPTRSRKADKPAPEPEQQPMDEVDRELLEPAEPMPETAKGVVDAGTGKPIAKADEPIKMTFEDVKAAAAKLAAQDTPALAALLKKYDAGKLSEVPKGKLGDFASDVMEALDS